MLAPNEALAADVSKSGLQDPSQIAPLMEANCALCRGTAHSHGRSSVCPVVSGRVFELCPHCHKPTLEDIDDLVANLGRREGGSVYNTTPTIELILGADDHFIGIAIHGDEAFGFLYLLHQIFDGHGSGSHFRSVDRAEAARDIRLAAWQSLFTEMFASSKRHGMTPRPDSL